MPPLCPSVCPSVCLSRSCILLPINDDDDDDDADDDDVVDVDCVEMAKHIVKHFSQPRSRIISVLPYETASRNSQGNFFTTDLFGVSAITTVV